MIETERSCAETRELAALVLAAGLGTRMRSKRAKVLHELGGVPMIARTLRAIAATSARPIVVVVGHQASEVEAAARTGGASGLVFAFQGASRHRRFRAMRP